MYELEAAHALHEDQPAFEQVQLHSLTRGAATEKLIQRWKSFLQRFRNLKPKETLVDHQPLWLPLVDLYVPGSGKASITYKEKENVKSSAEFRIFGSGFGGGISAALSESQSFNAEGIAKSYQMRIMVTAIHYASDDGDDQVRLEAELPAGVPEYRIVDLPAQAVPTLLDSPAWQILHKINLADAKRGSFTWQREGTAEANWKVKAGVPVPEALGIKLSFNLTVTRADALGVKYEMPYGNAYVFYQPTGEILLAPFCGVLPGLAHTSGVEQ